MSIVGYGRCAVILMRLPAGSVIVAVPSMIDSGTPGPQVCRPAAGPSSMLNSSALRQGGATEYRRRTCAVVLPDDVFTSRVTRTHVSCRRLRVDI